MLLQKYVVNLHLLVESATRHILLDMLKTNDTTIKECQMEYMKSLSAVGVVKKIAKNVLQHLPNSIISFIKYIYYKV